MKQYVKVVVRNNSIYTDNLFTYKVGIINQRKNLVINTRFYT